MERPKAKLEKFERELSGEVVYLDEMRRRNQFPEKYETLSDLAIQGYEEAADLHTAQGVRPTIMDEYEKYDSQPDRATASCLALADEFLRHRPENWRLSFIDVPVAVAKQEVLDELKTLQAGVILADETKQLAIESDGSYYPKLDITKQNSTLQNVWVRAFGWDDAKIVFTNEADETYEFPRHALVYPSEEKLRRREINIMCNYVTDDEELWTESIALIVNDQGARSFSTTISAMAYAETGYEGHGGQHTYDVSDEMMLEYADFIAKIVGDLPDSKAHN